MAPAASGHQWCPPQGSSQSTAAASCGPADALPSLLLGASLHLLTPSCPRPPHQHQPSSAAAARPKPHDAHGVRRRLFDDCPPASRADIERFFASALGPFAASPLVSGERITGA